MSIVTPGENHLSPFTSMHLVTGHCAHPVRLMFDILESRLSSIDRRRGPSCFRVLRLTSLKLRARNVVDLVHVEKKTAAALNTLG